MNARQIRDYLIVPTLQELGLFSPPAVQLLLGTCAQESMMGEYIHQRGNGPALGIYQMEPATHADIWRNFLAYHADLAGRIWSYTPSAQRVPDPEYLVWNLKYATALARVHYRRVPEPIPADLAGQAAYYKAHYNTAGGAATVDEYVHHYHRYVGDL